MKKITRRLAVAVLVAASICTWQITMAQTSPTQNPPSAKSNKTQSDHKSTTSNKSGMHHNKTGMKGSAMGMMDDGTFLKKAYEGSLAEIELGRLAQEKSSSEKVKTFGQQMIDDHTMANQVIANIFTGKGGTDVMANDRKTDTSTNAAGTGAGTGVGKETGVGGMNADSARNAGNANNQPATSSTDNPGWSGTISPDLKTQESSILSTELSPEHKALKQKLSDLSGAAFDKAYLQAMVKDHTKMLSMVEAKINEKNDASVSASPAQYWAKQHVDAIRQHKEKAEELLNDEMKDSKK